MASECDRCLQVAMHYEHYTKPKYQRRIIRILWMVSPALQHFRLPWLCPSAPPLVI